VADNPRHLDRSRPTATPRASMRSTPAPAAVSTAPPLANRCRDLPQPRLVEALRGDQVHRWRAGQRVLAEAYLEAFPAVAVFTENDLVLVWSEVLLRRELGESPQPAEYQGRFPPPRPWPPSSSWSAT
jgi:hypothetical protein